MYISSQLSHLITKQAEWRMPRCTPKCLHVINMVAGGCPCGVTVQNGRTQAHNKDRIGGGRGETGPEPPGPRRGTRPPRSGEAGPAVGRSHTRRPVCSGPRYRRGRVSSAPGAQAGATPPLECDCPASCHGYRAGVRERRLAACAAARPRLHRTCQNFPPLCDPASALPGPVMPEAASRTFAFGRPAPDPGPGRRNLPTTAEMRIAGAMSQSEASGGSGRAADAPPAVGRPWPAALGCVRFTVGCVHDHRAGPMLS